ncbi:MAG: hypothetical protein RJQ09_21010 [Cyclobacteriaceae bacterium]
MKKILKIIGIVIGGLLLLVLLFASYINFIGIPTYPVEDIKYTVNLTPKNVLRGKKLV